MRAKLIKKLIDREEVHQHQKWSAKTIMIYGKTHGYTPKINLKITERNSIDMKLLNTCFSSSIDLPYNIPQYCSDVSLDVENESGKFS